MLNKTGPLVSCIMATYNRRRFVPHAIRYFLRQQYSNKELIIIDDGSDVIKDLIPNDPSIKYFFLAKKISVGAKLNAGCNYANGDIIAQWDDDDWYSPQRLQYQVDSLKETGKQLCGINNLLYYDLQTKKAFQYIYPANRRVWLLGSSLCYKKELWFSNKFADESIGEDGLFVWNTPKEKISVLPDSSFFVHMIHDKNVSLKNTNGYWWNTFPVEIIHKIVGDDMHVYNSF